MQNKQHSQAVEPKDSPLSDADNVDKIRDILFGNQIKDFDLKFCQLQEQLNKELSDLSSDSKTRLDSLESFVSSELDSLNIRLDGEQKRRINELEDVSEKLEKRCKRLEEKLLEQQNQSNNSARELRQLLLEQSKEIFEKISQKQTNDREMFNKLKDDLKAEKVDRSTLSTLFTELALQISDDNFLSEVAIKK